jgi:hypothetical protein
MARKTRAELNTTNATIFVTGGLTPAPTERAFNADWLDSLQFLDPASTKAALEIVRAASGLTVDQWYKISNGTASNDKVIAIKASAVNAFYTIAFNLTDGTFGTYAGDVFTAQGANKQNALLEVSFQQTVDSATFYALANIDITACPAIPGFAWQCRSASAKMTGATTPYDTGALIINTAVAGTQFSDKTAIMFLGADSWASLVEYNTQRDLAANNIVENQPLQIQWGSAATVGDGDVTIYGVARLLPV